MANLSIVLTCTFHLWMITITGLNGDDNTNINDDDIDDGAYIITMMMTLMIQIFA